MFLQWLKNLLTNLSQLFSSSKGETVETFPPNKEEELKNLILQNSPGIGPKMTTMASQWFFHPRVTNMDYLVLVDFDYRETAPRMWVVDRKTGKSEVYKVAHGSNSDPDKDGYATEFSNVPETHKSSLGAMVTQQGYNSLKFKYSMVIDGLQQGLNNNVKSRAIVFHSSNYVNDVKGQMIGDSWGCFAVSETTARNIITKIDNGALLFAYHKSLDTVYKAPTSHKLDKAIELIRKWEGLRLSAYLDPVGIPTIGYGTIKYNDGTPVRLGDTLTETEAEDLLIQHIEDDILGGMDQAITAPINENQYCALVSFTYNLGIGNFRSSTLLRKLNAGDYVGASLEFSRWNKAGGKILQGLVNRRADERALFNSPVV